MKKIIIASCLTMIMATGCKKDSSDPAAPIIPEPVISNVQGVWLGHYSTNLVGLTQCGADLYQANINQLAGTFVIPGAMGSVSGTVGDHEVLMNLSFTDPSCTGNYTVTGTLNIANNRLDVSIAGYDCIGVHNGSGYLIRQ